MKALPGRRIGAKAVVEAGELVNANKEVIHSRFSAHTQDIRVYGQGRKQYDYVKRVLDVALSLFALILLLPLMLLIAVFIWIDDPRGSPLYISERCGLSGKHFRFIKFRTMCMNADEKLEALLELNEADGPAFKIKDDPRLTRLGKTLRKMSIDELPQLINIIKGDMSIVGPRPPLPREVAQYTPRQMQRLSVKPGLTCYWQVQPQRNNISFDDWIDMDLQYIVERNMWLDIKLILQTMKVVVWGDGR